jgi:hypothetical protein
VSANVAAQKEGFAASLVNHLFPGWRQSHPNMFASDVQFVYDWESSVKGGWDYHDPLNLRAHGTFKDPHAAMLASAKYLHSKQGAGILAAMRKGDETAAKHALAVRHVTITGKGKLPSPIDPKTGQYDQTGVPSLWDELGGTVTGIPGQAGKDLSGIGGMLSQHMVLIVLVVVAVLVLNKK